VVRFDTSNHAHDRLDVARWLYEREIMKRRGRLAMLCDRAHVLARSDRAETVPR
jgi:hypothetical protein